MNTKEAVIVDIKELIKLDVCTQTILDRVEKGDFDEDINDMDNLKTSEITDLIINLAQIK